MTAMILASQARKHWAEWLPERTKELKEAGIFLTETLKAAEAAHRELRNLMNQGYQFHEAEEVVLPKYILLPPEEDPDDEEAIELAEMEREYQENLPLML